MWLLSALNGDSPARILLRTASIKSSSGRIKIASGKISGKKAGAKTRFETVAGSIWPVTASAEVAISRPRSMDPLSPIKILALCQFRGKKPREIPTTIAEINEARLK